MRTCIAALLALVLAAGCGGGDDEPYGPDALAVSDSFARALVADGNPEVAASYASNEVQANLGLWHSYLLRDGVQTLEGPGSARSNCMKPFPVFGPAQTGNCVVYRLVGLKPIGSSEETLVTTARFRVWLGKVKGRWKVVGFDYTPQLEKR